MPSNAKHPLFRTRASKGGKEPRHKVESVRRSGPNLHCESCGRKVEWNEDRKQYLHK